MLERSPAPTGQSKTGDQETEGDLRNLLYHTGVLAWCLSSLASLCTYVIACMDRRAYTYMCVHTCVCGMFVSVHTCACVCICACIHVCMHNYIMCVLVHACTYMCIQYMRVVLCYVLSQNAPSFILC